MRMDKKVRVARPLHQHEIDGYTSGMSVKDIAKDSDLSPSAINIKLKKLGIMRSRTDARRLTVGRKKDDRSRLTGQETGSSYAGELSQEWIRRRL